MTPESATVAAMPIGRVVDLLSTTRSVVLAMTCIMAGLTVSTIVNYQLSDLPGKWWLVGLSSTAVGCGICALWVGAVRRIRCWCGLLWTLYGGIRSLSWLVAGSLSGVLAWLPCVVLGLVVFARRSAAPYARTRHEHPA